MKNILNIISITLILSVNLFAIDLNIHTMGQRIYLENIDPNIKVCELKQKINDKARVKFPEINQRLINVIDKEKNIVEQMENNKKLSDYTLKPKNGYIEIYAIPRLFIGDNPAKQKQDAEEDFKKCISAATSDNKKAAAASAGAAS